MPTITLNIPKEVVKQLEKDLKRLENTTKKPKDFHIEKATIRYLEHANRLRNYYKQQRAKGSKKHTTKELLEHLNLKEVDWKK